MTAMECGDIQCGRHDREADFVHEPRAPGEHHQGNYRSGQRRRCRWTRWERQGVTRSIWQHMQMVVGKVVQVAGPAVDCEFPEGQIPLIHTAIRITSEGFNVPDADRHHLRSAAAHRRRPRAHHRAAAHRRPGARHEGDRAWAHPVTVPVGKETLGRVLNVIGEPVDKMGPVNTHEALSDSPSGAVVRRAVHRAADVRDRHQGDRPDRAVPARRQDRFVRRRGRGQDRHHHGIDQQHRHEARRRVGVRRRGRAHARRQRSVARNAGIGRGRSARLHTNPSAR